MVTKEWREFWWREFYLYCPMPKLSPLEALKYDAESAAWFWSQEW